MNENQMKVLNYIKRHLRSPLVFVQNSTFDVYKQYKLPQDVLEIKDINNIKYLVDRCFYLSKYFASKNIRTGMIETYFGRKRSAVDIWRHVRYYNPDVTIFQVMDIISRENRPSNYCYGVRRRVFTNYEDQRYTSYLTIGDEFKLGSGLWRDIDKE